MSQVVGKVWYEGDDLGSGSLWVLLQPCLLCLLKASELVGGEVAPEEVGRVGKGGRDGLALFSHAGSDVKSRRLSSNVGNDDRRKFRRRENSPKLSVSGNQVTRSGEPSLVGGGGFPECRAIRHTDRMSVCRCANNPSPSLASVLAGWSVASSRGKKRPSRRWKFES